MRRRRGDEPELGQQAMKVGAVDIGTNSMRLLITDGMSEDGRWVDVTGLGRGVDADGRLSDDAMNRSLDALRRFGSLMDESGVERRMAIATSATRDASNRERFLDAAAEALGVRPLLISGSREARLAYSGAAVGPERDGLVVVSDIGGGSTEFVTADSDMSVDIGSVRLTERHLPDRPAGPGQLGLARDHVRDLFSVVEVGPVGTHIGVAGTWTSVSAIAQELGGYDPALVHGHELTNDSLHAVVEKLSGMSLESTAAIPSLDPKRAPVILAGAVVASGVMETLGVNMTLVSERDTLDGVAKELLALR